MGRETGSASTVSPFFGGAVSSRGVNSLCVLGEEVCGLSFGGRFCWFVLGCGRKFCGSVLVEETVSFSCGENLCVQLQGGGIPESVSWGTGSVYHYVGEFAPVSWARVGTEEGLCICPLAEESVCPPSGAERERRASFLRQPLSSQPWAALPPAGSAPPRAQPACCLPKRAPAP